MEVIFVDDKIKNLRPYAKKIRKAYPDICIVLFGIERKNTYHYGYERVGVLNCKVLHIPGAPEDGIAIQEWLNRYMDVTSICIVSNRTDLRPLKEYVVKPGFRFIKKVKQMLSKPYKNKMSKMIKGNMRKHF